MRGIQTKPIRPRSWSVGSDDAAGDGRGRRGERRARPEPVGVGVEQVLAHLEHNVVGQRRALREIGLLLEMHRSLPAGSVTPNAILMGPTGSGKSHTLRHAADAMGLPFVSVDASSLVPAGIVGEQVEDVLESLVSDADRILADRRGRRRRDDDIELAQRGVIVLDEFDKLAGVDDDVTSSSQAAKRVVQRRLLKVLEGARLRVGQRRHSDQGGERSIDTSGILVLASGAFTGLTASRSGPAAWAVESSRGITPGDLEDLGFLPELVGRLPILITFEHLSPDDLLDILDHERVTPLSMWRTFLAGAFEASLEVDDAAKRLVAERAASLGLGARGLQRILFPVLASKVRELERGGSRRDVRVGVGDVIPEVVRVPVEMPVQ